MIEIHDYDKDTVELGGECDIGVQPGMVNITRWDPYLSPDPSQEEVVLVWWPRSFACCSQPVWPESAVPWVERGINGSPRLGCVQCGTCGDIFMPYAEMVEGDDLTVTSPWVQAAAEKVAAREAELADEEEEDRLEEEEAEAEREAEAEAEYAETVERLKADLRDAIARGVDPADLPAYEDMAEPGVGVSANGQLVAWEDPPPCDDDPGRCCHVDGHPPVVVEATSMWCGELVFKVW